MGHEGQVNSLPEELVIPLADKGQPSNSIDNEGSTPTKRLKNQIEKWLEQLKQNRVELGQWIKGTPIKESFLPSLNNRPLEKKEYPNPEGGLEKLSSSGIETWDTRLASFAKQESGGILVPLALLTGGLGAGVPLGIFLERQVFASEENPPETRSTDSVPGGTSLNNSRLTIPIPSEEAKANNKGGVFDNEATSGVITPAMKEIFSKKRINQLDSFARLADQKTEIVTVPEELRAKYGLPEGMQFIIGKDKNTIEILPTVLDLSQTSKSDMDIEFLGIGLSPGSVDYDLFHDKGYVRQIELRMKDGSRIPKGAIINMFLLNEDGGYLLQAIGGEGKKDALIDIQSPNGDISRFKIIASNGEGKNTEFVSLEPLVPAPDFYEVLRDVRTREARYDITLGYNVVGDQPILQLSGDAERITINLMRSVKGNKGETLWPQGVVPTVLSNLAFFAADSTSNTEQH